MSTNKQTPLSQPTSAVRNMLGKEQAPQNLVRPVSDEDLREYCDKNYHQILTIIAEKLHQEKAQQEKLKAVKARLNFEEASRYSESETPSRKRNLKERLGPKVWFDDLSKESIDSYVDLRKTFLEIYLQQKKCIKDPIEIHNIKQRDGESTEEFVRRYKLECRYVKGAPECMKIFEFTHGITNPELIKRLHDKIPKSMDEMMSVTTAFLRGEWRLLIGKERSHFHPGNRKPDKSKT
nr:reverse transcriptase domain-containing protein [Tanacetum cinerariifolium]